MALFRIRSREIKLWRVAVLFVCVSAMMVSSLLLYARLNHPRSWQLHSGMAMQEVRAIMGAPDSTFRSPKREEWYYRGNETVELDFCDGRLCHACSNNCGKIYHPVNDPENNARTTQVAP